MRLQSLLVVSLLLVSLALASAAPALLTGVFSAQLEAGDQFGAVTVCNNVPAFVGGFRVNTTSRQHANLLQDVEVNQRTLPTPAMVDLGVEVKGGAVLAPGNGNRVFALAEGADGVLQFSISTDCSTWTEGENIALDNWSSKTMFSAASIGSSYAVFAGGLASSEGFQATSAGAAIEAVSGAPHSFDLNNARFGAVGVSAPESAWFVGGLGGDNNFTPLSDIEVVTWNASESVVQVEVSSRYSLSEARALAAGAYAQGKVFIAGGINSIQFNGEDNTNVTFSNVVDIFDLSTGQRTVTNLPGPARGFLTAVATDEFVFFAAGVVEATYTNSLDVVSQKTTDAVDIYHIASGSWYSETLLGGARMYASGVAVPSANVAIFAPGSYYPNGAERHYTDEVDVVFAISAGAALSPMGLISFLASFF